MIVCLHLTLMQALSLTFEELQPSSLHKVLYSSSLKLTLLPLFQNNEDFQAGDIRPNVADKRLSGRAYDFLFPPCDWNDFMSFSRGGLR